MYINELETMVKTLNVVLVQTSSPNMQIFLQDKLKSLLHCDQNSIIDVKNSKDLKEAHTLGVIQPFGSVKWLFLTDLKKVKAVDLVKTLGDCKAGLHFCVVSNYRDFKWAKKVLKSTDNYAEIYLAYLKRADFLYLYDNIVPESNQLSKELYEYVVKNYSGDIEAVFKLFNALKDGMVVKSKRDITALCGIGGNTVDNLVMSLLKSKPKTEKGLKTVLRSKINLGVDLAEDMPWIKIWSFSMSLVKNMIYVKELYISGVIYDSISKLPEGYDESKLVRLNRILWFIKKVPLSQLLGLAILLEKKKWTSEMDYFLFVYSYYKFDIVKRMKVEGVNK